VNTKTGETEEILREHEWLVICNFHRPTPTSSCFCHEGTWHEVDRIWTIHADGNGLTKIHTRHDDMEIVRPRVPLGRMAP